VVLIHSPYGQLSFARSGDEKWTWLPQHTHIQDCIYKDGLLYAVTVLGEIVAFNLSGKMVTTDIIMDRITGHRILMGVRGFTLFRLHGVICYKFADHKSG